MIRYVIPFNRAKNIGVSYNEAFNGLNNDDFVCFVDGDTIFLDSYFGTKIEDILKYNEKKGITINAATCMTNRVYCKWQIYNDEWSNDNMLDHDKFTKECWAEHGTNVEEITNEHITQPPHGNYLMSGVMILLRKSTWLKVGKFRTKGMLRVDNNLHQKLINHNEKLYLMKGIYLYHKYRFGNISDKGHLRKRKRKTVINVGRGRTGTTSLNRALRMLGYCSLHDPNVIRGMPILDGINEIGRLGYNTVTESVRWTLEDIIKVDEEYPNIKWILTTRKNKDVWYSSFLNRHKLKQEKLSLCLPGADPKLETLWKCEFYDEYNKMVVSHLKDRVLVLEAELDSASKWKKLCEFLGKDIPKEEYPFLNRS